MSEEKIIVIKETAAKKIAALLNEQDKNGWCLRVYIQGGGCSGFQYGFSFEEVPESDDLIVEMGGIKVIVDPLSIQYLEGAELDYQNDLQGSRFMIGNPNASTTCGCGMSFAA